MKRANLLILLGLLSGGATWAQTTSIQIGTNPSGALFLVDGNSYTSTQVFAWVVGSAHVVQFPFSQDALGNTLAYQSSSSGGVHYAFNSWSDNAGLLTAGSNPTITVTASPSLTSLIASVTPLYAVNIEFPGE